MDRRRFLMGVGAVVASWPGLALAEEACGYEGEAPSMIVGPFGPPDIHPKLGGGKNPGALAPRKEHDLNLAKVEGRPTTASGQIVEIHGAVKAAGCKPVKGAQVQLWQADHEGRYNHKNERSAVTPAALDPNFGYWGSAVTGADGTFKVRTVVPGAYKASSSWWRPPHIHWTIVAPGKSPITTQTYFEGDVLDDIGRIRQRNEDDLILHYRGGFEGARSGSELERVRRRALSELVCHFEPHDSGVPRGSLTFYV